MLMEIIFEEKEGLPTSTEVQQAVYRTLAEEPYALYVSIRMDSLDLPSGSVAASAHRESVERTPGA